jgi:thioester reductase-like protein
VLNNLKSNLASKSEDYFLSSAVRSMLGKLEEEGFGLEVAKFRQYAHMP